MSNDTNYNLFNNASLLWDIIITHFFAHLTLRVVPGAAYPGTTSLPETDLEFGISASVSISQFTAEVYVLVKCDDPRSCWY